MYHYTFIQWLLFFYFYCFFGWIFESVYVSILKHRFVNRGFLRLPLLPLYGTGAVMLLWASLPFRDHLLAVYLLGAVLATLLELATGWTMEQLFKVKYWDYSNQPFNFHGYICLSSTIAWGFLTVLLTEAIHPLIAPLILALSPSVSRVLASVISIAFLTDTAASVRAALNLAKVLTAMTNMRAELEDIQVQMALLKTGASQKLSLAKGQASLDLELLKAKIAAQADSLSESTIRRLEEQAAHMEEFAGDAKQKAEHLSARLEVLAQKRQELSQTMGFYRRGILRGNPTATSRKFGEALKELRKAAERK